MCIFFQLHSPKFMGNRFRLVFCGGLPQDDMVHFHSAYKGVCDKHDPEYYPKFKKVRPGR